MSWECSTQGTIRRLTLLTITLTMLAVGASVLFAGSATAAPINDCTEINQSGSYVAQDDITNASSYTCLPITANDVDLDLNGYSMPGSDITTGIDIDGKNVSIYNGTVSGHGTGISVTSSDSSDIRLENLTVTNNDFGIDTHVDNVTLDAVTVSGGTDGVTVGSGDNIHIVNSTLDGNNPAGTTGTQLEVQAATNVTIESTSLNFDWNGDPGRGLRIVNAESVTLRDLTVAANRENIRLHGVANITIDNVVTTPALKDDFSASDITDITVTNFQVNDLTFSFEQEVSDVTINRTAVPAPPSGLMSGGDDFVVTGLYPGQSLDVEETISATWFHPETAQYYHYNDSWETFPQTPSVSYDPPEVQVSATITENGPYAVLVSRTVESLELETSSVVLGDSDPLVASAEYADGTVVNATNDTTFLSETPDSISISDTTVTGEAAGTGDVFMLYDDPYTPFDWNGTGTITVTEAPTPLPEGYYGSVTINSSPAPAGTVVEARIDGDPLGNITVDSPGQYGGPTAFDQQLIVNGTAADIGDQVTFHIEPNSSDHLPGPANETSVFNPDSLTELNLTATLEEPEPPIYNTTVINDGTPKAVGLPAPTNATLDDMFEDISGINTFYAHTGDGWEQIWQSDHEFEALEAFALTTSGEGPATINITITLETDTTAPNRTLEEGWSFVAAPAFIDAEDAFGANETLIVHDAFDRPSGTQFGTGDSFDTYVVGSSDWGMTPPTVSPFGGYYVYADSPTQIPVRAQEFAHRQALDAMLGIS